MVVRSLILLRSILPNTFILEVRAFAILSDLRAKILVFDFLTCPVFVWCGLKSLSSDFLADFFAMRKGIEAQYFVSSSLIEVDPQALNKRLKFDLRVCLSGQ